MKFELDWPKNDWVMVKKVCPYIGIRIKFHNWWPLCYSNINKSEWDQLHSIYTTDLYIFWTLQPKTYRNVHLRPKYPQKNVHKCSYLILCFSSNWHHPKAYSYIFQYFTWNFASGLRTKFGSYFSVSIFDFRF